MNEKTSKAFVVLVLDYLIHHGGSPYYERACAIKAELNVVPSDPSALAELEPTGAAASFFDESMGGPAEEASTAGGSAPIAPSTFSISKG